MKISFNQNKNILHFQHNTINITKYITQKNTFYNFVYKKFLLIFSRGKIYIYKISHIKIHLPTHRYLSASLKTTQGRLALLKYSLVGLLLPEGFRKSSRP